MIVSTVKHIKLVFGHFRVCTLSIVTVNIFKFYSLYPCLSVLDRAPQLDRVQGFSLSGSVGVFLVPYRVWPGPIISSVFLGVSPCSVLGNLV